MRTFGLLIALLAFLNTIAVASACMCITRPITAPVMLTAHGAKVIGAGAAHVIAYPFHCKHGKKHSKH